MLKFFLVTMFLVTSAFANHIELKIDGEQYYCSKDPNNDNVDINSCPKQAQKIKKKYSVCPKEYPSSPQKCFNDILPMVKADNKYCDEVLETCYNLCPKDYPSRQSKCYETCYN